VSREKTRQKDKCRGGQRRVEKKKKKVNIEVVLKLISISLITK
jgi:hypothetical protein